MLKIFEIRHEDGEMEWCTGYTNLHALSNYVSTTECCLSDLDAAEIVELPKEKWEDYTVTDDEGRKSFAEWMEQNGRTRPDIIAGTMYDIPDYPE